METEIIKVSDLKSLVSKAHATLCVIIHALDTKVLVGEINRPEMPVAKFARKRRTKKEMEVRQPKSSMRNPPPPTMDLEKEYQAGRTPPILSEANRIGNPPEDKNTFYDAKTVINKGSKRVGIRNDPVDTSIEHFDRIKKA